MCVNNKFDSDRILKAKSVMRTKWSARSKIMRRQRSYLLWITNVFFKHVDVCKQQIWFWRGFETQSRWWGRSGLQHPKWCDVSVRIWFKLLMFFEHFDVCGQQVWFGFLSNLVGKIQNHELSTVQKCCVFFCWKLNIWRFGGASTRPTWAETLEFVRFERRF